jgi:rare lipoprotein A
MVMRFYFFVMLFMCSLSLAAQDTLRESGLASYYHDKFRGRKTASGERYDPRAYTAAHRTLPFGSRIWVLNPQNGKQVQLRVNDRGPFSKGRVVDVSYAAARDIGLIGPGIAQVEVWYIGAKDSTNSDHTEVKAEPMPDIIHVYELLPEAKAEGWAISLFASNPECLLEDFSHASKQQVHRWFVRPLPDGRLELLCGLFSEKDKADESLQSWKSFYPQAALIRLTP